MFLRNNYPALVWAVLILVLTLSPAPELPRVPLLNIPHFDKIVHLGMFGVLYLLLMKGLMKQHGYAAYNRMVVLSVIIVVVYGAATEVLQKILPTGRDADIFDWLADCAGAAIAYIIYGLLKRQKSISA